MSIPTGPIDTEPIGFHPHAEWAAVLHDVLAAAGVELGAYDKRIAAWFTDFADWSTFAVMVSWVARAAASREPAPAVALPGRFDASPAEVDRHLRRILAEDTYLRYQQCIGGHAVMEAAKDQRMQANHRSVTDGSLPEFVQRGWRDAADHVDPYKGGGPYPSRLLCSEHNGFGPCPGAPTCAPRDTTKEKD